tara:strand:- start:13638 stop:14540 length:903 start_codon:yes stop_codon:yes gene_type:complete
MKCTVPQYDRITSDRLKALCCNLEFVPSGFSAKCRATGSSLETPAPHRRPIVFCKTDHVADFFEHCNQNPLVEYVLVTADSDRPVSSEMYNSAPSNIRVWFGTNIDHHAPNLYSIPLGSTLATWIGDSTHALQQELSAFELIEETGEDKSFVNLVYMNFGGYTNPNHRLPIYNALKDKSWVTARRCDIPPSSYEASTDFISDAQYIKELYNHKFTISPLGNGVDCGRVWQALYLGVIPIIPRHINVEFYKDLPILIYDDINELTPSYLEECYINLNSSPQYDKAKASYWACAIKEAARTE